MAYFGTISIARQLTANVEGDHFVLRTASQVDKYTREQAREILDSLPEFILHPDKSLPLGEWTLRDREIKSLWNVLLRAAPLLHIDTLPAQDKLSKLQEGGAATPTVPVNPDAL